MPDHGFGGRPAGSVNVHSSSADEIRALVHQIDLVGEWPTSAKARRLGMKADNRRFTPIRDAMYEAGELATQPPAYIKTPAERREYLHAPGRPPEPEKPKAEETAWRPSWARGRTEDEPPLADAVALSLRSFFEYRKAWARLESWPVDFFRRIVPVVRRKKRKRVKG